MNTALRIFAALSSGLAVLTTSWVLYETFTIPLFLLLFFFLAILYIANLPDQLTLPSFVRHAAYFSSVSVHTLAALSGILSFCFILFLVLMDLRDGGPIGGSRIVFVKYTLYAFIAPAGLFVIMWLNKNYTFSKRASFLHGAFLVLPLAGLLFISEYFWIKYHENRLSAARAEDVISSLHSLSKFPISQRQSSFAVCKKLLVRDISNEYFMYNDNDTTFRPDKGIGKIETALSNRFGDQTDKVIGEVKARFGSNIMLDCADWTNPSSG